MTKISFYKEFEAYLKGESSGEGVINLIQSDDKGDSLERMNIYRDAYTFRLVDILFGDFPTIHQILGDDDFSAMAFDYVKKYPSTSFTVRYFGQNLSKYLSENIPYKNHSYLAEIANFEWSKGTVFDAPDTNVMTLQDLVTIPVDAWLEAKFEFIPAIKLLTYQHNIPQIWQAVNDDILDTEPTKLESPISWVMWRSGLSPSWYSLDVDEEWALTEAQKGADFSEICEGLLEWIDENNVAARAASFIQRWVSEGLIAKISYSLSLDDSNNKDNTLRIEK